MIKTTFVDVTKGDYEVIKEYPYNITCSVGEYVDFDNYKPYADDIIFKIINIIHLPNEAKKIVEIKHFHTNKMVRKEGY
jgi:hypothetical protein